MADKMADYIAVKAKLKQAYMALIFVLDGLYRAGAGDVAKCNDDGS